MPHLSVTPPVRHWPRALAAALAMAGAALPAAGEALEAISVRVGDVEAMLPAIVRPAGPYVSLKGLAAVLGGEVRRTDGSGFLLLSEAGAVEFPPGMPGLARAGEQVLSLGADALIRSGDLYLPREAVDRVIAALQARRPSPGAFDDAEPLRWTMVGAGPGRLKLELALPRAPLDPRVRRNADGSFTVEIPGVGAVRPPWTDRAVGGALVERLEVRAAGDDLSVVVIPGPSLAQVQATSRGDRPGVDVELIGATAPAAAVATTSAVPGRVRRVVIDPGHGGSEDGAIGPGGIKEKELVLDVARRLSTRLQLEGFEVRLTREDDVDMALDERAGLANEYQAELFVSLHANASRFSGAFGAETYFLAAEATDDEARTLAALENDASRTSRGAAGEAIDSDELPLILWDMAQVEYLQESARLAETIQARLNRLLGIKDRGVRQAPFRVLVGATCPAVLIELGFVTNGQESRRLAQPEYRDQLAETLKDAIRTFREEGAPNPIVVGGQP